MRITTAAACVLVVIPSVAAHARLGDVAWDVLSNAAGAQVAYPRSVFQIDATETDSDRLLYTTLDGRSRLELFSIPNKRGEIPSRFMRRVSAEGETFTYQRVTGRFFAASTTRAGLILYRRCNFKGAMIHCVDLRYPAAEKRKWDDIVTRVSLSLRPR
jgi:hypothetical protein